MSVHIVINGWSGGDAPGAAAKLAKVFRLDQEEAAGVVEGLAGGNAWQFPHQVSEQQSQMAQTFLSTAGFEVECREATEDFGTDSLAEEPIPEVAMQSINKDNVQYVGFWVRFAAMLIDSVLLSIILTPIFIGLGMGMMTVDPTGVGSLGVLALQLIGPAAAFIAFWKWKSATPGKMIFKAVIVDEKTLGPMSTGQCVIRYIGYIVSSIIFCIGFLMIAFTGRKQGLHDIMAKTVVIKAPA